MTTPVLIETPKPKLRWYQFSLRSLLIGITLFGLACSWLAVKIRQAERQKCAVEAITKSGGSVYYDFETEEIISSSWRKNSTPWEPICLRSILGKDFFSNVLVLEGSTSSFSDSDLAHIKDLAQIEWLFIAGTKVTDSGLVHLKEIPRLHTLMLGSDSITDKGLKCLNNSPNLAMLELYGDTITNAGLEHLKGLSKLEKLALKYTSITDEGLAKLKALPQLKHLSIWESPVTSAALSHIKQLRNLQSLTIWKTKITYDNIEKLQKALPKLRIDYRPEPTEQTVSPPLPSPPLLPHLNIHDNQQ